MGLIAERMAREYGMTQETLDEWAVLEYERANTAQEAGYFNNEVIPVDWTSPSGHRVIVKQDQIPGRITLDTIRKKGKYPFLNRKEGGMITQFHSSRTSDLAVCIGIANDAAVEEYGLKRIARLVGWSTVTAPPDLMGLGLTNAITALFQEFGVTADDVDLFELNTAFVSVVIKAMMDNLIPDEKTNVNGGATALGHGLGATGGRLVCTLLYELLRRDKEIGFAGACVGQGQGEGILFEMC